MSVNINEINRPINSEKRDPFYGRSKSEVGLGLVPNMSFEETELAILANVKNTVDEGVSYNFPNYASEAKPIVANIVKLKPNSARTTLHFSLGTWTKNSEFISRDTATIDLRSNRTNVSYNLFITEPYDKTGSSSGLSSPLFSTKIFIKEFKTGGWLVTIVVTDRMIDSIWVNLVESKNIDVQNPYDSPYDDSEFERIIEIPCDKSKISTNLEIGGLDIQAKSLTHPVPIKLNPVDPNDYYNTQSNTYTLTNIDISNLLNDPSYQKSTTLTDINILTDEETCKSSQLIPLSVNRLNHQIKFRLSGSCINPAQLSSWRAAQSDQRNLGSFLDTSPDSVNEYPISIDELSHDINFKIGNGKYYGSIPESGVIGGTEYGKYYFSGDTVNYATLSGTTSGRNDYSVYDQESRRWIPVSSNFTKIEGAVSLSTKSNVTSRVNLTIHGLDHDIKIEAVDPDYRNQRGKATKKNGLLNSTKIIDSGIRNLTWDRYEGIPDETRRNSYVTGSMELNTFEKDIYQCLNLKVHGLDHNIKLDFYRMDFSNPIKGPSAADIGSSDKYRPRSNGKDLLGNVSIDTFTSRVQSSNLQVIDSRYTDCARGLAIRYDNNFMPYDLITDDGSYGCYNPENPNSDELERIYPTINGIPFTGDFRHKIKYPANLEVDGISKFHDARNIIIPSFHLDSSLNGSGGHKWEVLETVRVASYNENGDPVSKLSLGTPLDSVTESDNGYGVTKLSKVDKSILDMNISPMEKLTKLLDSLSSNEGDVVSVKVLKLIIRVVEERFSKLENNILVS